MRENIVRFHSETRRLLTRVQFPSDHPECSVARHQWMEQVAKHDMEEWRPLRLVTEDDDVAENVCSMGPCWEILEAAWNERQEKLW